MSVIQESITIAAGAATVFAAYVQHIDAWWPRTGTYRYSFAPASRQPRHIQFEGWVGGRFYETFDDGSEYEIGRITHFQPPRQLVYTWQAPDWPHSTTVQVTFEEHHGATTVHVRHSGFSQPEIGAGYRVGLQEILASFTDWLITP